MLPERVSQIPADQASASVTADGACDTRNCHDAIAERGATAIIPPRRTAKPWKGRHPQGRSALSSDQWRTMPRPATRRCGRRNTSVARSGDDGEGPARHRSEGGPERYHRGSRAETKMHGSNSRVSAAWRGTSIVRWRNSRCASPSRTASPPSAYPSQRTRDNSVQRKAQSGHQPICATATLIMDRVGWARLQRHMGRDL